jgi:hypothetical protein
MVAVNPRLKPRRSAREIVWVAPFDRVPIGQRLNVVPSRRHSAELEVPVSIRPEHPEIPRPM